MCPITTTNLCYIANWNQLFDTLVYALIIGLLFGFFAGIVADALKARKG